VESTISVSRVRSALLQLIHNIDSEIKSLAGWLRDPELYSRWVDKAIDSGYKDMLNDLERPEMHAINEYGFSRSVHGAEYALGKGQAILVLYQSWGVLGGARCLLWWSDAELREAMQIGLERLYRVEYSPHHQQHFCPAQH
jgi:hypothetical protein